MRPALVFVALAALGTPWIARADGLALPAQVPAAYRQECASCHVAYPPRGLPAASWQRIMAGLDRHYGTDASLDAATVRELSGWLQTHAGRASDAPPEDRITRSAWFVREHRRIDAAAWAHPAVRRAANCAACHPGAERGDYDDDRLALPPGLGRRARRDHD